LVDENFLKDKVGCHKRYDHRVIEVLVGSLVVPISKGDYWVLGHRLSIVLGAADRHNRLEVSLPCQVGFPSSSKGS